MQKNLAVGILGIYELFYYYPLVGEEGYLVLCFSLFFFLSFFFPSFNSVLKSNRSIDTANRNKGFFT